MQVLTVKAIKLAILAGLNNSALMESNTTCKIAT